MIRPISNKLLTLKRDGGTLSDPCSLDPSIVITGSERRGRRGISPLHSHNQTCDMPSLHNNTLDPNMVGPFRTLATRTRVAVKRRR